MTLIPPAEAGHCDSSYPPGQEYTECTGPRASLRRSAEIIRSVIPYEKIRDAYEAVPLEVRP